MKLIFTSFARSAAAFRLRAFIHTHQLTQFKIEIKMKSTLTGSEFVRTRFLACNSISANTHSQSEIKTRISMSIHARVLTAKRQQQQRKKTFRKKSKISLNIIHLPLPLQHTQRHTGTAADPVPHIIFNYERH